MKASIRQQKISGRISREDGEATKARIIEAAGCLFAERGYAETTSKEICEAAKTNITGVNYHFGSREGLYRAVVNEVHSYLVQADMLAKLAAMDIPPKEKLGLFIDSMVEVDKSSWQLKLWVRETVTPSKAWQEYECDAHAPKFEVVHRILSDLTGIPIREKELMFCFFFILSPLMVMKMARQDTHLNKIPITKYDYRDVLISFKDFVFSGMEKISQQYATKGAQTTTMNHTTN